MPKELPYFRWYPADAESDFRYSALSLPELGLFHRCLNFSWLNDGLPADPVEIGRSLRISSRDIKTLWPRVSECFELRDGRTFNRRQEEERIHARTKSERNTSAVRTRYERTSNVLHQSNSDVDNKSPAEIRAIRLSAARKIARHSNEEWQQLLEECNSCCVRCGDSSREILKDHITPIYKGGGDGIGNLQPLCSQCNASKGPDSTDYRPEVLRLKYVRTTNELQHARARAASASVSVFGSGFEVESNKKTFLAENSIFPDWWKLWSKVRGTHHSREALQAWMSVVPMDLEGAAVECTASYLDSLDNPAKGFNPDTFLFAQAKERFASRWPSFAPRNGQGIVRETRAQRLAREMDEEGTR